MASPSIPPAAVPEDRLVRHLASLQQRPLAQATRERLAQALLDWFTAGWSGATLPAAATLRALAATVSPGAGPAPVFGGAALAPLAAGFANAGIAHLREIDDAHRAAMLHPGIVAISPVLALAAVQPLPQRRVADAIIAGYEVALRLGEAMGPGHAARFHATATAGTVGAAAAAGVALGLSADQLHHALGIAATQAAGLWQLVDDGAHEAKALHPAFAVRNGMTAAWAARDGLPGAQAFVTGARGLHALLAGDGPLSALDPALDLALDPALDPALDSALGPVLDPALAPALDPAAASRHDAQERINTATIKAWPCCAQLFTPLDATLALMQAHGLQADAIAAVEVVIFPHALKIAGVHWPARPAEAAFCLRYVLATLLLHGRLTIDAMEAPELQAPALLALAQRISVRTDDAFQRVFPAKRVSRVSVTLRDGSSVSAQRELRRGDPEDPFTWPQLQQRLRSFAPAVSDATAHAIGAWCATFADAAHDGHGCSVPPLLFTTAPSHQPPL